MEWMESISRAIEYIEDHITDNLMVDDIAEQVSISPFYFQKGFSLLCGFTIMEYIRNRRLSLAGNELATSGVKVVDVAIKYGYDSPDSFSKAFSRFHGVTPSMVQKNSTMLKTFAPLKIKISLEGGYLMEYRIAKKNSFTVIGASKCFKYENAQREIPEFWKEPFAEENYCIAIEEIWNAEKKYDSSVLGYDWDNTNPKIQLERIGERGYIELLPIKEK